MHLSAFVAAVLLPYAASVNPDNRGGPTCENTCYSRTCLQAGALWAGVQGAAACEAVETWGCDCSGCDCDDILDLDDFADDVPEDYSCGEYLEGITCDDMVYLGYSCHYMETRQAIDCSGCLCEETLWDYTKGDGSCPKTCVASDCDFHSSGYNVYNAAGLESYDWVMGCDCSGCENTPAVQEGWSDLVYNGMDCNGNGYWNIDDLGDDTCGEEVSSFSFPMGNPDDGYEERSWFVCLNCPELDCDMGDCGDSCERTGDTCALPLCELCADEDSVHSPTQFGRSIYCTEDSYTCAPVPAPTAAFTGAPSIATEATVTAEDGANMVTSISAVALALCALVLAV